MCGKARLFLRRWQSTLQVTISLSLSVRAVRPRLRLFCYKHQFLTTFICDSVANTYHTRGTAKERGERIEWKTSFPMPFLFVSPFFHRS